MTDFSSLQLKIEALKAMVEYKSITPLFLGSLLDYLIKVISSAVSDRDDYISGAKQDINTLLSELTILKEQTESMASDINTNIGDITNIVNQISELQPGIISSDEITNEGDGFISLTPAVRHELFDLLWVGVMGGTVKTAGTSYELGDEKNLSFARALPMLTDYIKSKPGSSDLSNVFARDLMPLVLDSTIMSTILRQRSSGSTLYPHTLASLVKTADGDNVDVALEKAKLALAIDIFNKAAGDAGKYDPEHAPDAEHPFSLNELWLSYAEFIQVLLYRVVGRPNDATALLRSYTGRTLLPIETGSIASRMFGDCAELETVHISGWITSASYMFSGCRKLRKIFGVLSLAGNVQDAFAGCVALESVMVGHIHSSISFADSPLLSLDSLRYLVGMAANTEPITVTVHPDVYAKLTSLDAWRSLLADALDKNITFATA